MVAAALLFILAVHCWSIPLTFWEYDECLYAAAIEKFEPLLHHPPPPGSPVYVAFAKVIALFTPTTLTAMIATSVLALGAGSLGFVLACLPRDSMDADQRAGQASGGSVVRGAFHSRDASSHQFEHLE